MAVAVLAVAAGALTADPVAGGRGPGAGRRHAADVGGAPIPSQLKIDGAGPTDRHELPFQLETDADNFLGRRFCVLYEADAASKAKGSFIGDTTGTGTWELPPPTVAVIDRDGVVAFADVSPDWLVRTEAEPILEAVQALTLIAAE